ncbi:alpha/beta hydrolase [Sphingomonas sp.]|jgi:pimeloyl-ACP methyl ester carboxylesterase|uniref:alpha/beta fold hydrolase n=1 Tax=Sphingomonas sp. TaxID=28214 RepID=UPI002D7FD312|nr:alpha/beta hydrolase [Sphingomonas sp.]HEU0045809.1 alpha/beta hydrolase [Sphingomonas sp.]
MMIRRLAATLSLVALLCQPAHAQQAAVPLPARDEFAPARAIIADVQKIVTPNGIDETLVLELGGARQVVNIRGADRFNPILIYIHGGPGSVEMPMAWSFQHPWEDFFTVVQWDQRGAGRSFPLNDLAVIAPTLRLERYRDDAIALIEQLCARFGQPKVFVLGHSFGSAVGLALAQTPPDLLHAYIGMGQLIDFRENERVGMRQTLAIARERGDVDAVRAIMALQPYPHGAPFTIEQADAWRKYANRYGSLAGLRPDADFYFNSTKLSPLYTPADLASWAKGSAFTATTLWPRLADVSFTSLRRLNVPVAFLLGRRDKTTPSEIASRWLNRVAAPSRTLCWLENSGYLPMIEEPGRAGPWLHYCWYDLLPIRERGASSASMRVALDCLPAGS